jgi:hypothetical protein
VANQLLAAQQLKPAGCAVPGCRYVATDMSSWRGHLTAEQGADTPVWLALLPPKNFLTGAFVYDRAVHSF